MGETAERGVGEVSGMALAAPAFNQLFDVVENDKARPVREACPKGVPWVSRRMRHYGVAYRFDNPGAICDTDKGNKPDPTLEVILKFPRRLDRQACLAGSADAGQGVCKIKCAFA